MQVKPPWIPVGDPPKKSGLYIVALWHKTKNGSIDKRQTEPVFKMATFSNAKHKPEWYPFGVIAQYGVKISHWTPIPKFEIVKAPKRPKPSKTTQI